MITDNYNRLNGRVDVWVCRIDSFHIENNSADTLTERYLPVLDQNERARYAAIVPVREKYLYLRSHAMLRHVLSRYIPIQPHRWQFDRGSYGRPSISETSFAGVNVTPLNFNLSHSGELIACVISRNVSCGIDVEKIRTVSNLNDIARQVLSPSECDLLASCDKSNRLHRFFTMWTLKEALAKALGLGIGDYLRQITIGIPATDTITVDINFIGKFPVTEWTLQCHNLFDDYRMAIAVPDTENKLNINIHNVSDKPDASSTNSKISVRSF